MRMLAPAQNTRSFADRRIDRADFRMLEAQPLDGVVQLDVHAEVVGVELQLVAGPEAAVLPHVHGQRGDAAVEAEPPVLVSPRLGPEVDLYPLAALRHHTRS